MKVLLRILFVAFAFILPTKMKAGDPVTLNVHHADGTKTAIQLYTRPQISFDGNFVIISSPVLQFRYNSKDVIRFTYSGGQLPDEVKGVENKKPFTQKGEILFFDSKVKSTDIKLYSEDGKTLPVKVYIEGNRPTLSLSSLRPGVYLLSINGSTTKILKR